jgi:hypothetical protein
MNPLFFCDNFYFQLYTIYLKGGIHMMYEQDDIELLRAGVELEIVIMTKKGVK